MHLNRLSQNLCIIVGINAWKRTFPVYHEIKLWLWYFVSDLSKKVYGIRKRSLLKKPLETRRSNTIKKITGDTKCLSDLSSLLCPFNSQGNIRRLGHQINSINSGLPWPFVPPITQVACDYYIHRYALSGSSKTNAGFLPLKHAALSALRMNPGTEMNC